MLTSLHEGELDLVIGGLTRCSPWKHQVALSRAYYVDSTIVSSPTDGSQSSLKSDSVAVEAGSPAAADLRKRGAIPVPVTELAGVPGLIAVRPGAWDRSAGRRQVSSCAPTNGQWLSLRRNRLAELAGTMALRPATVHSAMLRGVAQ